MSKTVYSSACQNGFALILAPALAILTAGVSRAQQPAPPAASASNQPPELMVNGPDKRILFSTTLIEARSGDGKRTRTGTGFVFNHDLGNHQGILFIVTCRHVLDGFASATLAFVQRQNGKPDLGHICRITAANLPELAFYDPDPGVDVALIPLKPLLQRSYTNTDIPYFQTLDETLIPNRQATGELSAIQPIVFAGYPKGLHDETNLLPLARGGFTASPYAVDFDGLPVFLIDANVAAGSSGSPVVVLDQPSQSDRSSTPATSRFLFLGLLSDAYFETANGNVHFRLPPASSPPVANQPGSLNIGAVIKPGAILNTIDEYLKIHPFTAPDDSQQRN